MRSIKQKNLRSTILKENLIVPNKILHSTAEEDENEYVRKKNNEPDLQQEKYHWDSKENQESLEIEERLAEMSKPTKSYGNTKHLGQPKKSFHISQESATHRNRNVILDNSSSESSENQQVIYKEAPTKEKQQPPSEFWGMSTHNITKDLPTNNLILNFSDDSSSECISEHGVEMEEKVEKEEDLPSKVREISKYDLKCDSGSESEEQENRQESSEASKSIEVVKMASLSNLMSLYNNFFIYAAIPESHIFQCLVKRQSTASQIRYKIFESSTLKNFMTVIKDSEGFVLVSLYDSKINSLEGKISANVVGKMFSNFFGTEFNCFGCYYPYKKPPNEKYEIFQQSNTKIMTIQYQTNLFGLKGPRKMKIFVPKPHYVITGKKKLNQIFEEESLKNIGSKNVSEYMNKPPIWNESASAYVLNFRGRATISSVKNFLITSEKEKQEDKHYVLFGKIDKEIFNLDIKHPFSIMQGVCLAISSYDKKLACQ